MSRDWITKEERRYGEEQERQQVVVKILNLETKLEYYVKQCETLRQENADLRFALQHSMVRHFWD